MKLRSENLLPDDIQAVMEIWLEANCRAHSFIPLPIGKNNYEYVRRELPGAEILVCEAEHKTRVLSACRIIYCGTFCPDRNQGRGIGTALLKEACRRHVELSLRVYAKE